LLVERPTVLEGLHGRPALTVFSLIGPFVVVVMDELVEVDLDFLDRGVDFFPEGDLVEFVLDDLIQPLC